MRLIFGLVLIAGVGLAGFAVMMAKNYINAYQAELSKQRAASIETVEIFVVNKPLKYGDLMTKDTVRKVRWPKEAIPEGVFADEKVLFPGDGTELRTVLRSMERNEAVMAVKITEPGQDAGIISRLERGMRAFAIKVDVATGVSGFLRPGDLVDVYWTGRAPAPDDRRPATDVTKLIEANVKIIAIDQTANDEAQEATIAQTVTVSASPQQVAALAQAQSTGRLSLSLVGNDDDTVAETIEVDQRSLLGIAEIQEEVAEKEEEVCTIRTRRGAEVVEIPIPCTN